LRRARPAHTILTGTYYEEDVMPTMKFTNDEIGTLLHALRTEVGEWLSYKTLHGSSQNINSVSTILKNTQALEARVQQVYDNMTDEDDEAPEPRGTWHREHGWLPKTRSPILDEIDAFNRAVNVSWGIPRARIDVDQDQIEPGTWTAQPDGIDLDDWPFDVTDPEPTTAGIDTQATSDGKVRIDITVGGRTLTVDGHESLLEALSRLNRKF